MLCVFLCHKYSLTEVFCRRCCARACCARAQALSLMTNSKCLTARSCGNMRRDSHQGSTWTSATVPHTQLPSLHRRHEALRWWEIFFATRTDCRQLRHQQPLVTGLLPHVHTKSRRSIHRLRSSTKPHREEHFSDTCCNAVEAPSDHHQTVRTPNCDHCRTSGRTSCCFFGSLWECTWQKLGCCAGRLQHPFSNESFKMWHASTLLGRGAEKRHRLMAQPSRKTCLNCTHVASDTLDDIHGTVDIDHTVVCGHKPHKSAA